MIPDVVIEDVTVGLLRRAAVDLPTDVEQSLREAEGNERDPLAKGELRCVLDNTIAAREDGVPLCQDTGLPVFFILLGAHARTADLPGAIKRGVERATDELPLRPNAVHPISRNNTGTNTGRGIPHLIIELVPGRDDVELWALPKGAGSENMSALAMLNPDEGEEGVERFVVDTVLTAGGRPCPPTVVGVGIGGCADEALILARRALLRTIGTPHDDPEMAKFEHRCQERLNASGIGPMGLGGDTTVLAVHALTACCHTASLPVGVVVQCWADRRAGARINADGGVVELTGGPTQ